MLRKSERQEVKGTAKAFMFNNYKICPNVYNTGQADLSSKSRVALSVWSNLFASMLSRFPMIDPSHWSILVDSLLSRPRNSSTSNGQKFPPSENSLQNKSSISQPARRSASHPVSQPASQPAGQPASQPAS